MKTRHFLFTLSILVIFSAISDLDARVWFTDTGQTFEGDFVRKEGESAIFNVKGKDYPYPIARLRVADRLAINRLIYEQGNAPASGPSPTITSAATSRAAAAPPSIAAALKMGGQTVKPGERNEIEFNITDVTVLRTIKDAYGKPSTKAKMLMALPNDFDPGQKPWPLLIVSSTTDGDASSIKSAQANYLPDVTNKGYVLLAVDGELGKPEGEHDSTDFRWALVSAALDAMNKEWPKSKTWPVATAGVSGGAGYASHQAMMLLQKQTPLIGMLLAVSGWDPTDFPDVLHRTPFGPLHNLPIFMSAGETDSTATKEITDKAHQDVTKDGFRKVRFEHFAGGHQLNRPHLQAALDWFLEENTKSKR